MRPLPPLGLRAVTMGSAPRKSRLSTVGFIRAQSGPRAVQSSTRLRRCSAHQGSPAPLQCNCGSAEQLRPLERLALLAVLHTPFQTPPGKQEREVATERGTAQPGLGEEVRVHKAR